MAHIGLFLWAYFEEQNRTDNLTNKKILRASLLWARAAARCLNFDLACILLPICRNMLTFVQSIPYLHRLIPFEKHKRFHIIIAFTMAFFTAVHTVAHWFNYLNLEKADKKVFSTMALNWTSWAGTTGQLMVLFLFLIMTSAMKPIRQQAFELFWYTHHLAFPFFFCALVHAVGCLLKTDRGVCYPKTTWKWVLLGLTMYAGEMAIRWFRGFQFSYIRKVIQHPSKVVEIQVEKKSMTITAGQYVFINVPEISVLQWHPFTLTTCENESYHSVHINVVGDWTSALAKRLGCMDEKGTWLKDTAAPTRLPRIRVDGPFGTPSENVFENQVALLVGAGIGVTPFASILKSIW
jgi:predicted ferric reductase